MSAQQADVQERGVTSPGRALANGSWAAWAAEITCSVCGDGRIVVAMYMMYGGRLAYCRVCWYEVWGERA